MKDKAPNVICVFTDPLGVTDVGGTLAKHAKNGGKVLAVILWEYPQEVMKQIAKVASILGIEIKVLGYSRGEVKADLETKKTLVKMIRETKPEIAITFDHEFAFSTTHGDHIITNELVMESLGMCYRHNFAPEQIKEGLEPHFVKTVYYPVWEPYAMPNVIVDITDFFDLKLKATLALKGQSEASGKFIQKDYSKKALKALIPSYEEARDDPLKLGEAFQTQRREATARYWGHRVWGVVYGEPFRVREPLKLDLLQY
jgi:LmbE family N-acetylglucosaminyl deacetylase